jgi:mannose-1-phosphate guanylyltransferase
MNVSLRNAFVLGAGLGTRLGTLTASKPKPLIPICHKPLITFAFDHLIRYGISNLVVNTHHQPDAYDRAFPDRRYKEIPLTFRHEPDILETAGGLKNAEDLLAAEPFVVHNGDVLTDLPIDQAVHHHFEHQNEVTLVLRSHGGPLQVSLSDDGERVLDIAGRLSGRPGRFLFSGIYIVDPKFLSRIPCGMKISVIPIFLNMIERGNKLGAIVIDSGKWWDLGTRDQYLNVHRHFAGDAANFSLRNNGQWPQWIHSTARVAATAQVSGATAIGAGAFVGDDAALHDCVVWENASVAPRACLTRCIVTAGRAVEGRHTNRDF